MVRPLERLLVRLPNWLGDALMSRPLLHALRAAHPAAELRAVGPRELVELLAAARVFDQGHPWPAGRSGRAALERTLRAWRPEAALVLPPSFSSALFARRCGAAVRVGFRHEARRALLTRALPRPARGDLHLSREYLLLGAELGAHAVPLPDLALPAGAAERAAALLAARGLAGRDCAVLGPGATYGPAKRWSAERFAALGRALAARGLAVLVCGAAAERATCAAVAEGLGPAALVLAGETDLAAQAALLARAAVAVCNDSGLAHLSAAVGTPTVTIFGSTSSAWTAPLGRRVRVVQHAPVCAPCFQRSCRIGTPCLEAVTVAGVGRAVDQVAA
ncbi:MAG: lipopolysaccharide heptosyltransferase II [Candidatus Eisenbacteria bacterium]|nr:lipopolysaccharide heptosyltransferase II [Candidatus Eisenbacteria bacterium]